jgi:hypothetical protein
MEGVREVLLQVRVVETAVVVITRVVEQVVILVRVVEAHKLVVGVLVLAGQEQAVEVEAEQTLVMGHLYFYLAEAEE